MPSRYSTDMLVIDALEAHPKAKDVLESFGLPCWRCIVAEFESIEQGARAYGLDARSIVEKLEREAPIGGPKGGAKSANPAEDRRG